MQASSLQLVASHVVVADADTPACLDIMDESALLDKAAEGPALTTLPRVPEHFMRRFVELLMKCLLDDAAAQAASVCSYPQ